MPEPPIVLASASPRRRDLLSGLALGFETLIPDVDESGRAGESPEAYVERVARTKAEVGVAMRPEAVVIAADTTVAVDGRILAKPTDAADAERMLGLLAGRVHLVHTAVVVRRGGHTGARVVTTEVEFSAVGAGWIRWYVGTGEPMGKAGAYAVQGLGAVLVAAVRGSMTNVIGLPVLETCELLESAGISLGDRTR